MSDTQAATARPKTPLLARRIRPNGAAIIAIRERTGLTQNALAMSAGVAQSALSYIEAGKPGYRPTPATLKKLAVALAVPLTAITSPASDEDAA